MASRNLRKITSLAALSVLVGLTTAASAAPALHYWSLNESVQGAEVFDSIAANNGGAFGSPNPVPSDEVPFSDRDNLGSMLFDGQNYFKLNNTLSSDFSICAWIKTSSTGGGNHWENAPIAASETGGFAYDYGFGVDGSGRLSFGNGGNITESAQADVTISGEKTVNDNLWHHVCVTRSNTNGEVNLYVDGALDKTGTTGVGLLTSNREVWIGHGQDGNQPFVGHIDELRFFQTVLTPAEVQEDFSPTPTVIEEEDGSGKEVDSSPKEELADTGESTDLALLIGVCFLLAGLATFGLSRRRS
jgi:LPXTG-motif cell wall-anchored protein